MRILVLGGFGNFGARICRALAADDALTVLAGGRHPPATFPGGRVQPARIDIGSPGFAADLRALSPGIVIHCAGPFQAQDYAVARAALGSGAHYVDLADGREFVARFAACNDGRARDAGRLAITGASTLPALSSAVVDALIPQVWGLEEIHTVISPGQHAPRGAATIAAVLSYAGRSFRWLQDGRWRRAWGWQELEQVDLAVGPRLAAACDVPDLELFPERYSGLRTVVFRAALEVRLLQAGLYLMACLRRAGVSLPVRSLTGVLEAVARLCDPLGTDEGGMRVRLQGTSADGGRIAVDWELVAPANHGPEVPCMAAVLLARKLATGSLQGAGAYPAMGLLTLDEFQPEFARWGITTAVREIRF